MPNASPSPRSAMMWDGGMKAKQSLIALRLSVSINVLRILWQCALCAIFIDVYTCEGSRLKDRPKRTLQEGHVGENIYIHSFTHDSMTARLGYQPLQIAAYA